MLNADYLSSEELQGLGLRGVGANVSIHRTSVLVGCERISIGSNVRIDPFCVVTAPDAEIMIASWVHLSAHVALVGGCSIDIGDFCNVSHGAKLFSVTDDYTADGLIGAMLPDSARILKSGSIVMAAHSCIGANSVVLPAVAIGEGTTVGALSLVTRSLPPWAVYAGVPAKKLADRDRAVVLAKARSLRP